MPLFNPPPVGTTDTITVTNGVIDLALRNKQGWIPAPGTWSFASSSSITTSYTATDYHTRGDRLYCLNTADKFFYVVSVATNTLTVTGGDDYVVQNLAITDPIYSKEISPRSFPEYFNYTPSPSATAPLTLSSVNTFVGRFQLYGTSCNVQIGFDGTLGGSAGNQLTFGVPITSDNTASSAPITPVKITDGASGGLMGFVIMSLASTTFNVRKSDNSNWNTSGTAEVFANFFYEIA